MHIEQKLSRFLSEMVLAPSLGLKKVRYNIQRCYVYCNGLFSCGSKKRWGYVAKIVYDKDNHVTEENDAHGKIKKMRNRMRKIVAATEENKEEILKLYKIQLGRGVLSMGRFLSGNEGD